MLFCWLVGVGGRSVFCAPTCAPWVGRRLAARVAARGAYVMCVRVPLFVPPWRVSGRGRAHSSDPFTSTRLARLTATALRACAGWSSVDRLAPGYYTIVHQSFTYLLLKFTLSASSSQSHCGIGATALTRARTHGEVQSRARDLTDVT